MTPPGHPPLGEAARRATEGMAEGRAVHMALVSVVCNSLHRHAGPIRAVDCGWCPHRAACVRQVDDALVYVAALTAPAATPPGGSPDARGRRRGPR